MKIRLLLPIVLLTLSCGVSAQKNQNREARMEEMKTQRIAYIIQQAGLTPEETEKFLPLYNEYKQKSFELGRQRLKALRTTTPASDAEFEKAVNDYIHSRQKDADLAKEYNAKFRSILSPEKLFKLYVAEWEFQQKALTPHK